MDLAILEAEKRKAYISGDEELIRVYEMREMALSDLVSMENYAREEGYTEGHAKGHAEGKEEGRAEGHVEGRAEGHAKGRAEREVEIVRNLKKAGIPLATIVETTGLSEADIESL